MKRLVILAALAATAGGCVPKTETTVTDNTMVTDMNSDDVDAEGDGEVETAGWSFQDKTDPITDERTYNALVTVAGASHNLQVQLTCSVASGQPTLTMDGFDKNGQSAPFAYNGVVQYRGDRSGVGSISSNNTRFSNSREISTSDLFIDSYLPFLGSQLVVRVPFSDGDDTFTIAFDDGNFRNAMTPCVAHWKQMKADIAQKAKEEDQQKQAQDAIQTQSDQASAPASSVSNNQPAPF